MSQAGITKIGICGLLLTALGLCVVSAAFAQPPAGMLASGCTGCHGTGGTGSTTYLPMIGGLNQEYLRTVLMQYKRGERPSTIMERIARGYTDDELQALVAFFASQTWRSPDQEPDEGLAKKGEKVHQDKCAVCHKDNGRYMDAETPRIAGQGIPFLMSSLEEYRDEERRVMKKYMKKIMEKVRSRQIKALAHFYASQK